MGTQPFIRCGSSLRAALALASETRVIVRVDGRSTETILHELLNEVPYQPNATPKTLVQTP